MSQPLKIIGIIVFSILILSSLSFAQQTEQLTITTYYPSPYGVYNTLRLFPRSDVHTGDGCTNAGELAYSQPDNVLLVCDGVTWQKIQSGEQPPTDDLWTRVPGTGNIYNTQGGVVGIGVQPLSNDRSKLHIDKTTSGGGWIEVTSGYTEAGTSVHVCTGGYAGNCSSQSICGNCCSNPYNIGCIWESNQGCFASETQIALKEGSKPISQLKKGDLVKAFDIKRKQVTYAIVQSIIQKEADSIYVINGIVKATAEHPFYTDDGWKTVKKLKVGDKLFNGKDYLKITSIQETKGKTAVYNLSVASPNNFFAEGLLVHNKPGLCYYWSGGNKVSCSLKAGICTASEKVGTSKCVGTTCCNTQYEGTQRGYGLRVAGGGFTDHFYAGHFDGDVKATQNVIVGVDVNAGNIVRGPVGLQTMQGGDIPNGNPWPAIAMNNRNVDQFDLDTFDGCLASEEGEIRVIRDSGHQYPRDRLCYCGYYNYDDATATLKWICMNPWGKSKGETRP